jgi:nitrogen fixation protein NifQ
MHPSPTVLTNGPAEAALPWPAAPASTPPAEGCRDNLQAELLGRPVAAAVRNDPLRPLWASLLAGRALQQGVLTATLGLLPADWHSLWAHYFPGDALQLTDGPGEHIVELDDLLQLLLEYRAGLCDSELWLAHSLAWACSGRNHLWQDLGLANRGELSLLMHTAFPALAGLNGSDMKWKKFIYRHYCAREGIYVCPAPSCGECSDYSLCFAKEE